MTECFCLRPVPQNDENKMKGAYRRKRGTVEEEAASRWSPASKNTTRQQRWKKTQSVEGSLVVAGPRKAEKKKLPVGSLLNR